MASTSESTSGENTEASEALPNQQPGAEPVQESWFARLYAWFQNHYGLDLRSLAIFRIGLGYLLLSDLFWRSIDLRAHYTDIGILTRERLVGGWGQKLFYSLHVFGGDWVSQAALFLIAAIFAFMLLVGYRTRLAVVMSWVMLCSLQGRNYIVLQGGDDILRVMVFWAIFVPLGARFSVDAVLAERSVLGDRPITPTTQRRLPKHVLSIATMVLVMQLFTMYFVSAALKTGPTWHRDGSAIHLALHHHAFASHIGTWFRQLPVQILQGMTWQVWWLELVGPVLFFIPWGTFWWRTLQAFLFISFHFGLYLTMELGHFPWVAMVAWLAVLPAWFWERPLYWLTTKKHLRSKLRQLSIRAQTWILSQSWLGRPFKLPRIHPTLLSSAVVLAIASYATYGSAYAMTHKGSVHGEEFHPLLMSRLYANWGMFAPNPPNTSGWFVSVAKQKNGNEIDVWNGGQPVTFDMPRVPSSTYRRQRWRKFGDNILSSNHAPIRGYFLRWLCLDWNEDHDGPQAIESITLYHMAQTANWPSKGYGPLSKNELARENCPPPPGEEPKETVQPQSKPQSTPPRRTTTTRGATTRNATTTRGVTTRSATTRSATTTRGATTRGPLPQATTARGSTTHAGGVTRSSGTTQRGYPTTPHRPAPGRFTTGGVRPPAQRTTGGVPAPHQ